MRNTTLLAVFCAAALIGCEPVSEPEVNVPDPSFALNRVLASAFGTGNFTIPDPFPDVPEAAGRYRIFSFNALKFADRVEGRFQVTIEGLVHGSGDVICMGIFGSTAQVGGIFTHHPTRVGQYVRFRVMDNGAGGNVSPDEISFIYSGGTNPQPYCDNLRSWPEWYPVEDGNIVVRGG